MATYSYNNPYGATIFPIGSGGDYPDSYGDTIFPVSTGGNYPNPYGDTIFTAGPGGDYPDSIYLTNSLTNNKPVQKSYPKPGGLLLSMDQYSLPTPFKSDPILLKPDSAPTNPAGFTYPTRAETVKNTGNMPAGSIFASAIRNAIVGAAAGLGTAMTHQLTAPAITNLFAANKTDDPRSENLGAPYSVMPFTRKKELIEWSSTKYKDSRSFKGFSFSVDNVRLDGASATVRNAFGGDVQSAVFSGLFAAATAAPGGAYTLFNLESLYGFGNHGDTNALRRDFSARSQVATNWIRTIPGPDGKKGKWIPTINPIEMTTEFRGDKINVIDFGQRKLSQVYQWKPSLFGGSDAWNKINDVIASTDLTRDFIKFYFTGPKLQNGVDETDDIIVFRATIDSFSDSHQPSWEAVQMVGRADPNYHYTGYSRDVSLSFTVFATSRDEMKPIYRKLNALAGYTVPEYGANTIAMKGPWMRMTIGDLLVQQPVVITSLQYTFIDSDTTWEINIEQDSTMMQVPHKVSVQLSLHVITDSLPQKGGRMYSLAKRYQAGQAIEGSDNWLSDFQDNAIDEKAIYRESVRKSGKEKQVAAIGTAGAGE